MPTFLVGGAYAVSAGLIIYGIAEDVIPDERQYAFLLGWASAGLVLAFIAAIAVAVGRGKSRSNDRD